MFFVSSVITSLYESSALEHIFLERLYDPGTVPGAGDTAVNNVDQSPALVQLTYCVPRFQSLTSSCHFS